jgi:hypothetical protein
VEAVDLADFALLLGVAAVMGEVVVPLADVDQAVAPISDCCPRWRT